MLVAPYSVMRSMIVPSVPVSITDYDLRRKSIIFTVEVEDVYFGFSPNISAIAPLVGLRVGAGNSFGLPEDTYPSPSMKWFAVSPTGTGRITVIENYIP